LAHLTVAPRPRQFALPKPQTEVQAVFGDVARLLGYDLARDRDADRLTITLWWQAVTTPSRDYKRFLHLYDPQTERIPAQDDAMPRNWTYPTSWWVEGEVISDTIELDLRDLPVGEYDLAVGWYDPGDGIRLSVTGAALGAVQSNRLVLPDGVKMR
jgi:hypothetical protein